jgi:outer membrane lipoprotein-sorting protein
MKYRFLFAATAALLATSAAAQDLRPRLPVQPAPAAATQVLYRDVRLQALARANQTLNEVTRLQGRFVQNSPDGSRATGTFYLQRPGKLRFEYNAPATLQIISDGTTVFTRDSALRTTDRTPLRNTPLNLVLRGHVDLDRDANVTRVARQGDWLFVNVRDRNGLSDGQLTLWFNGPNADLRAWDVVDATGARTRVTLNGLSQPASIDPALFRADPPPPAAPRHP